MKRQRFTLHIDGRERPFVVLAYDADAVRARWERTYGEGKVRVTRGDYRKQARQAEANASPGFKLDSRALQEAQETLGLRLPVRVRFNGRQGGTNGNYRRTDDGHNIMVKRYLSPDEATRTLWHELTHALQSERQGSRDAWNTYSRAQRVYPYRIRPIEVEARETSERMAHIALAR